MGGMTKAVAESAADIQAHIFVHDLCNMSDCKWPLVTRLLGLGRHLFFRQWTGVVGALNIASFKSSINLMVSSCHLTQS
jgi:hypothetical protein